MVGNAAAHDLLVGPQDAVGRGVAALGAQVGGTLDVAEEDGERALAELLAQQAIAHRAPPERLCRLSGHASRRLHRRIVPARTKRVSPGRHTLCLTVRLPGRLSAWQHSAGGDRVSDTVVRETGGTYQLGVSRPPLDVADLPTPEEVWVSPTSAPRKQSATPSDQPHRPRCRHRKR